MAYTFVPKQKFAKASLNNGRISAKASVILCRAIRKKPLVRAKRLLRNLTEGKQTLEGKTYDKAAEQVLALLESCEKNAEFKGLDTGRLMVHASATHGTLFRRRRRKGSFGSQMKSANVEIMLIERGKEQKHKVSKKKMDEQKHKITKHVPADKENQAVVDAIEEVRQKSEELREKTEKMEKAE